MIGAKALAVSLLIIKVILCNINNKLHSSIPVEEVTQLKINEKMNLSTDGKQKKESKEIKPGYMGENFPDKYLVSENYIPTIDDLNLYINSINNTVNYFSINPNNSKVNTALGLYYMKALLKKSLQDYINKFEKNQYDTIAEVIRKAENILSHYIYGIRTFNMEDLEYRVSLLFKDDSALVFSIDRFNRNRLKKWIRNYITINDFLEQIDQAILPKEKYVELAETMKGYNIMIGDSDRCLSHAIYNPEPINVADMRACRPDPFCVKRITSNPSVAYTLSHRTLNLLIYRQIRRCYFHSPEEDLIHVEQLCAVMYREVVYIARRGYFARDLFLEHIALCALLGYEEFFRRHWFRKAISWMDEDGCIYEFDNFELNRTRHRLSIVPLEDKKTRKTLNNKYDSLLQNACHSHPMALLVMVLAHAIRHAAHYLPAAM